MTTDLSEKIHRPAPIVIFGYRRPGHLMRVLEALESQPLAKKSRVFIFLDGPKSIEDRADVEKVREVAQARKWNFAETLVFVSKENQGLDLAIPQGLGRVFRENDRAIIVEDDVVASSGFLEFMNQALTRYQDIEKVMQISGYAYPIARPFPRHFFLPLTSCWGWGTWSRAWKHHEWDSHLAESDLKNPEFVKQLDLGGVYPFSRLIRDVLEKNSPCWDGVWYWKVMRAGGVTLFPARSFVENIGWDGSGTHQENQNDAFVVSGGPSIFSEVAWPESVQVRPEDLDAVCKTIAAREKNRKDRFRNVSNRFKRWIRKAKECLQN